MDFPRVQVCTRATRRRIVANRRRRGRGHAYYRRQSARAKPACGLLRKSSGSVSPVYTVECRERRSATAPTIDRRHSWNPRLLCSSRTDGFTTSGREHRVRRHPRIREQMAGRSAYPRTAIEGFLWSISECQRSAKASNSKEGRLRITRSLVGDFRAKWHTDRDYRRGILRQDLGSGGLVG